MTEDFVRLNESYKTLNQNLNLSNRVRQQSEDNLLELQRQYRAVKEAFNDKEQLLAIYKAKYEEE